MARFWYINCPICTQGRLFVQKRCDTASLFLCCEECSVAWDKPEDAATHQGGRLGIDIDADDATAAEIEKAGWSQYAFHGAVD